jgi:hypothetical protein
MDKFNDSTGQETVKRDQNMCRLEEVERCIPTQPIPHAVHGRSTRECRRPRSLLIYRWILRISSD